MIRVCGCHVKAAMYTLSDCQRTTFLRHANLRTDHIYLLVTHNTTFKTTVIASGVLLGKFLFRFTETTTWAVRNFHFIRLGRNAKNSNLYLNWQIGLM